MLNFTEDLDEDTGTAVQVHRDEVPAVQERVTVTPISEPAPAPAAPSRIPTHRNTFAPHSEWEALRDYVISKLEEIAPFPREPRRENTIFMGFQDRWGEQAMAIAQYVFEQAGGEWLGAPMSVARFDRASDRVFAAKIAALL